MADNVTANPGASGAIFATDDIGGVHYPRTKIVFGADGSVVGDVSGSLPLPVTGAFFGSNPIAVTGVFFSSSATVVTGILPVTGSLFSSVGVTGVLPVTGSLFSNVGVTGVIPVTGSLFSMVGLTGVIPVTGPLLGNVAHDAADSGNPVKVGARAVNVEITQASNNDRSDMLTDLSGKLLVMPYSVSDVSLNGNPAAITTGASVSTIGTQGAGLRIYVTDVTAVNSHATIGTTINLLDGNTSTVIWQGYCVAAGGGVAKSFIKPPRTTASNPLFAQIGSSGANVILSVQGYAAP